jgi:hypothetical protein
MSLAETLLIRALELRRCVLAGNADSQQKYADAEPLLREAVGTTDKTSPDAWERLARAWRGTSGSWRRSRSWFPAGKGWFRASHRSRRQSEPGGADGAADR